MKEPLPYVEFELFTFIKIVWLLIEAQHTQALIEANYVAAGWLVS